MPQAGWLPGHTFLGTLTTRIGNGGPAQTVVQPGINWVYGWQMNKWLVLRGSTGVEFIIDEPSFQPHHGSFIKNLGTLGIEANLRIVDENAREEDDLLHVVIGFG